MLYDITNGQTSVVLRVKLRNSSVATGAGLTGLTSASSGLIISTIADNEATATAYTVAASHVEAVTTLGTYATPTALKCRFKEVDATNHPGLYEVQIADARFAVASAKSLTISFSGATNLAECDVVIPLRAVNPYLASFGLSLAKTTNLTGLNDIAATAIVSSGAITTSGGAVSTVTTVTNQLTAAAIATGVWQDAIAGDFTTASSIGKSLYTSGVVPGASGGLLISGTNSGTTTLGALTITGTTTHTGATIHTGATTHTGAVTMANGLAISQATTDTAGLLIAGNGTGAGLSVTGGATGAGAAFVGGGTSGAGVTITTTSGDGFSITPTAGHAVVATANGTSKHGFIVTGGTAGTSDGLKAVAGTGGVPIRGNITGSLTGAITGNITGNLSGTIGASQSFDNSGQTTIIPSDLQTIKTQTVTCAGGVTFPASTIASISNITGGTITTVTNLTNLPSIPANWLTAAGIASGALVAAVWDGTISGHTTGGTFGGALNAAGSAGDPWSIPIPGAYGAGTAGNIVGNNLNATITSRMATFTLPANFAALGLTAGGKVSGVVLVDTLTTYTGDTPQTGDSFARIGATGSGLSSIAPASTALSTAQWTNTRAGYQDNLSAGAVALASQIPANFTTATFASAGVFSVGALANAPTGGSAPTASAIATAVWQDTTAGDFATAGSIGKGLFTSGNVPGASGGLFIAGTNAATVITTSLTTTFTGNLTGNVGGSVGSVAGSVASVTGNVNLNLGQAVPTSNTAQTIGDALNAARAQGFGKWTIVGTTWTFYAADGLTVVRTFTLDSATTPTQRS